MSQCQNCHFFLSIDKICTLSPDPLVRFPMPPNIKETTAVIDSLATLNVNDLVHSKFLPLTQEVASEASRKGEDTHVADAPVGDTLLPLTTKEQVIADILQDEASRQMFTIDHIESNMMQQAQNKSTASAVTSSQEEDEDNYWDMPAPSEEQTLAEENEAKEMKDATENVNGAKINGDLYCLWHILSDQRKRQDLIVSIVEDEKLREAFSVSHIEASLIADAKRRSCDTCGADHTESIYHESDSYWMWEMEA